MDKNIENAEITEDVEITEIAESKRKIYILGKIKVNDKTYYFIVNKRSNKRIVISPYEDNVLTLWYNKYKNK